MEFYDLPLLELERTLETLTPIPDKVLLQFPDGLLGDPIEKISQILVDHNIIPIIAGDPSYGACDLPVKQAELLKINVIFHFGHSTFAFPPPASFNGKIFYFPVTVKITIPWKKIVEYIREHTSWSKIGFLTTIQHIESFDSARKVFSAHNLELIRHKEGQLLGCNQDRALKIVDQVDGFLVIAGGDFHASPVVIATNKETIRFDPFNGSFKLFDQDFRNKYFFKRYALIEKARKAKNWGIIVSTKSGQLPKDFGISILSKLKKKGFSAKLFVMDNVNFSHLINFETIDAWVINLCPRIATDDYIRISKPILTVKELFILLNDISWEEFIRPKSNEGFLTIDGIN